MDELSRQLEAVFEEAFSPAELLLAEAHTKVDDLELALLEDGNLIDLPLCHHFTPGMYIREIFMPAGAVATSKTHKIAHPYTVIRGRVAVFIPGEGVQYIEAPYSGITKAGTRRVLLVLEDTTWITYHPNPDNLEDLELLEEQLIERREIQDGSGERVYDRYQRRLKEQSEGFVTVPALELLTPLEDYMGAP